MPAAGTSHVLTTPPKITKPATSSTTEASSVGNRVKVDLFGNDDLFDNEPSLRPTEYVVKSPLDDDLFSEKPPKHIKSVKPVKQTVNDLFGEDKPVKKATNDNLFKENPVKPVKNDDLFGDNIKPVDETLVTGLPNDLFKSTKSKNEDESDLFTSLGPLPKPKPSTEQHSPATVKKSKAKKVTKTDTAVPSIFADVPTIDHDIVTTKSQPVVVDDIFASSPPAKTSDTKVSENMQWCCDVSIELG